MTDPYNPLDKLNLGKSVVEALLALPAQPIGSVKSFEGAGIYAIYYQGAFEPYQSLVQEGSSAFATPIYVGKAVPSGARKGASLITSATGRWLFNRIAEHRESIDAARNLSVSDFSVRFLVVDDIWIPLGEALLISTFSPVWNRLIDGFGNHDPGAGRYNGLRPLWDVIHPGRHWAEKCKMRSETPEEIGRRVIDYFEKIVNIAP
jgi:Eco29kI restriction endonuclease